MFDYAEGKKRKELVGKKALQVPNEIVVQQETLQHPNIREIDELTWYWLFAGKDYKLFNSYAVMDEILTQLNMPANVEIEKAGVGVSEISLKVKDLKYTYVLLEDKIVLRWKETPVYKLNITPKELLIFFNSNSYINKDRISIYKEHENWTPEEVGIIEQMMNSLWEKEKQFDIFTIYKTLSNILKEDFYKVERNKEGEPFQVCEENYYSAGKQYYWQDRNNWKVVDGIRTTNSRNGKVTTIMNFFGETRKIQSKNEQQEIEEVIYRFEQAPVYQESSLETIRKDVLEFSKSKLDSFVTIDEENITASYLLKKTGLLPKELKQFLMQLGFGELILIRKDEKKRLEVIGAGPRAWISSEDAKHLKIATENGEIAKYVYKRRGIFQRYDLKIDPYYEETIAIVDKRYRNKFYSLNIYEEEFDEQIRKLLIVSEDKGKEYLRELLKETKALGKKVNAISYHGREEFSINFNMEFEEVSTDYEWRDSNGNKVCFDKYKNGTWDFKMNGCTLTNSGVYEKTERVSKEDVEAIYEKYIAPNIQWLKEN